MTFAALPLPIYIAVLLVAKAIQALLRLLAPLTAQVPAGTEFRQLIAILLPVVICFVVGLIAAAREHSPSQVKSC
jgi:hypothetical protein